MPLIDLNLDCTTCDDISSAIASCTRVSIGGHAVTAYIIPTCEIDSVNITDGLVDAITLDGGSVGWRTIKTSKDTLTVSSPLQATNSVPVHTVTFNVDPVFQAVDGVTGEPDYIEGARLAKNFMDEISNNNVGFTLILQSRAGNVARIYGVNADGMTAADGTTYESGASIEDAAQYTVTLTGYDFGQAYPIDQAVMDALVIAPTTP